MELWQILGISLFTAVAGLICWVIYTISSNLASPVARQLPGPKPSSYLFGNVEDFSVRGTPSLDQFEEWAEEHGGIFRYYVLFCEPVIVVTDPQILKHIYVTNWKNYQKIVPAGLSAAVKFLGCLGLVFSNGELHKRHRKMINPVFKLSNLKKFLPIFEDCTKKLSSLWLQNLEEHSNSEAMLMPIKNDLSRLAGSTTETGHICLLLLYQLDRDRLAKDLNLEFRASSQRLPSALEQSSLADIHSVKAFQTLEIIGKAAFGFDFNCIEKSSILSETFTKLTSTKKPFRHFLRFLPFWESVPLPENVKTYRERSVLSRCVDGMIARKRDLIKNEAERENIDKDLLGMMLLARDPDTGESLTGPELRDETMTFLAAGHETTSLGLSWTLLYLSLHPSVQAKCREEICSTLPESNITFEDTERLKYLNAAILESLRLRTPAPASLRQTMKDDFLGGYYVPAGTKVLTLHGTMQRLSINWNCPLDYDPNRFLDQKADASDVYMPFGAGPRKCIGMLQTGSLVWRKNVIRGAGRVSALILHVTSGTYGIHNAMFPPPSLSSFMTKPSLLKMNHKGKLVNERLYSTHNSYWSVGSWTARYKFAMLELVTVLAILLREFEFFPHPSVEYKSFMLITQSPYPNLELLVRKHG